MRVKKLRQDLAQYAKHHGLTRKLAKQVQFLEQNPRHPSLHTEVIEPKHLRLHSFRIDLKYRAIFIIFEGEAEIVDINHHYAP